MFSAKNLFVMASSFACVAVSMLGVPMTRADLVNPSFESPDAPTDGYLAAVPSGWTAEGSGSCYITNGTWASTAYGSIPDGSQIVEIGDYKELWQNTGIALQDGWTYTVNFQAGTSGNMPEDAALWATLRTANNTTEVGSSAIVYQSWATAPNGGFSSYSLSGTYHGANKYLTIDFSTTGTAYYVAFDNVSISSTFVPEPSSIALLTTGILGLLCYAWRKRR